MKLPKPYVTLGDILIGDRIYLCEDPHDPRLVVDNKVRRVILHRCTITIEQDGYIIVPNISDVLFSTCIFEEVKSP